MKLPWYTTDNILTLNEATLFPNYMKLSRFCDKATVLDITLSLKRNILLLLIILACTYRDLSLDLGLGLELWSS